MAFRFGKGASQPVTPRPVKSILEDSFDAHYRLLRPDETWLMPERQIMFHPTRKWRIDRGWTSLKVGIEIQGGTFIRGGHSRGASMERDFEKYNELQKAGWRLMLFGSKAMDDKHVHLTVQYVIDFLEHVGRKST